MEQKLFHIAYNMSSSAVQQIFLKLNFQHTKFEQAHFEEPAQLLKLDKTSNATSEKK